MFIDTHTHIPEPAGEAEKIILVGTSLKDSQEAIKTAQENAGVFATVGIHPSDDPTATAENLDWQKFKELAGQPKVVAIGECGLDYHQNQNIDRQRALFFKQIAVAAELNLPLSIHIRDARDDVMSLFTQELAGAKGVFHCFSGDKAYLDFILKKLPNFYLSFAGNVTFKNAKDLQELARLVPLEKLLLETDSPYLAPEPYRGLPNFPANVKITASRLAEIHGVSLAKIAEITSINANRLFHL